MANYFSVAVAPIRIAFWSQLQVLSVGKFVLLDDCPTITQTRSFGERKISNFLLVEFSRSGRCLVGSQG
ncbi:hypothetical protein M407DRAFT_244678 [Tulasnella calospora MUT 4182]|uniref:Uncharacterized protein n=1 Tax=Tulasnella calospora MUT 4182 TaxID=1051891 RepID=A0A0C3QF05_9AGAM|nr:hypothetical protein M407DRAFT_244678 [Tulasnella calospora MUT 4182]